MTHILEDKHHPAFAAFQEGTLTPKRFNMTDLTAQLTLAASQPQEGQQQTAVTLPPAQTSEAPSRPAPGRQRLKLTPRQTTDALTGGRAQMQAARTHAELWLQALRAWRVVESERTKFYYGPAKASRMRVVGVGSTWGSSGGGRGESGSYWGTVTQVITPVGGVSESALAAYCNADPLLSEVRRGAGLATLIHASGRGWAGQRARQYGRAVLRLAAALGDARAEQLQHLVFAED